MSALFYDLTELLYLSRGFKGYYGIAKVVAEGARYAFKADENIRFIAFHQGFNAFFEIFPKLDPDSEGGVDLNIPNQGLPLLIRRVFTRPRMALSAITTILGPFIDWNERRKWRKTGVSFTALDMKGATFVTCARPKLILHPMTALRTVPNVKLHVLLHDAIPLHDQKRSHENFTSSFQADTDWVMRHADQIIANSIFSAEDLAQWAEKGVLTHAKTMTVAQLAHECQIGSEEPELVLPDRPFVLMVGTALGRKNLDVVLAALKRLIAQGKTPPLLVLAGRRRERTMKFIDSGEMESVKPHVLQIDSPNQTDLERLFKASLATILPSHIEGWGLPAAEALWHGKPAFCSDIPVLREVCGEMGQYFGTNDDKALAKLLYRVTHDPDWRTQLENAIVANRANLRSWDDFGRDLISRVRDTM